MRILSTLCEFAFKFADMKFLIELKSSPCVVGSVYLTISQFGEGIEIFLARVGV